MSAKHHYVSKFHLKEFCDPDSLSSPDPWLWVGQISTGEGKRRSPKKVAIVPLMFDGPGGLVDREATIESFLGNEVEGPAAIALREMKTGHSKDLPPELMRYLAWAGARSLPMQRKFSDWGSRFGNAPMGTLAEPAPHFLENEFSFDRLVRVVQPASREVRSVNARDAAELFDAGWVPDFTAPANFLETVHVQAAYLQVRWFPRLRWFTLRPPTGEFFIIGDRPVGWGVPGCLNAPPCCLRDESAFLIAPLTRSLALVGRNSIDPWSVTPTQINGVLASWSQEWIAGPSELAIQNALRDRRAS